jgi:hypothetical protein
VVVNRDPHEFASLNKLTRNPQVLLAGLRVTGGMIVDADERGCVSQDSATENGAWLDDARSKTAFADRMVTSNYTRAVESYHFEDFAIEITHQGNKYGSNIFGCSYPDPLSSRVGFDPSTKFEC